MRGALWLRLSKELAGVDDVGQSQGIAGLDEERHGVLTPKLEAAWQARTPGPGLIFHSDRGSQYCSFLVVSLARDEYRMRISMSRKGNPYDNAIAESFFKTLKDEEFYLMEVLSYEELEERLPEYIDGIYNTERLHSVLGYLPPVEFEAKVTNQGPAGDVITIGSSGPD